MSASTSTTIGVFGYLPGQPDFVRVRAAGREIRHLEDWIERGLHQARWQMGGGFAVAYPHLFHRFIFRPDNSEHVVAGILCASVDSHKRPFPFVAFDLVPTQKWDRDPAVLLARSDAFFVALEDLTKVVGPLSHIGQVHGQVAAIRVAPYLGEPPPAVEGTDEEARYRNFLQETTCGELGLPAVAPGTAICHDLLALLGNGQNPRLLRHAVALPLCRPPFARDLELRFYLSLVGTLLADQAPTWTLFWQRGGSEPGRLLLCFREPVIEVFSALLGERQSGRGVQQPGTLPTPLPRPYPGLADATSLQALLAMSAAVAGQTLTNRREKTGIRS